MLTTLRRLADHGLCGDGVGHEPRTFEVQPHDGAEPLGRDRLGRGEELPAGVVDQQVDAAAALEDGGHEALDVPLVADVARVG